LPLRSSNTVVFCAIDELIPIPGNPLSGFADFLDGLAEAGTPCVWVSSRNRHQLDIPIRKLGQAAPFIAEGGSGVYLPEDYFHLKPARTVRLGRFTCIPVATAQPAAAEALESLAGETSISVVPLRSLSSRELMQNTGLPRQEADALRQRDFDELFFFAGTSDADIEKFRQRAEHEKLSVRRSGSLWSLAVNANLARCVQELCKLYDRSLHAHAFTIALGTTADSVALGRSCDRAILLTERHAPAQPPSLLNRPAPKLLPLFAADTWRLALDSIQQRSF
jgi:predicted mannosyl-3-phosphoglycerate phosphatase (HAD superfamily)